MKQEIETLREALEKLLETEPIGSSGVLSLSKELDKIIVDQYK